MSTTEAWGRERETDQRRNREETLLDLILQSEAAGSKRPNVDTESAVLEWAVGSIGSIADEVDRIVERNGAMIASMSARGDRIDRVQAENRAAIEALLSNSKR